MDGFIELLIHGLLLVGYGALTVALTIAGTFVEYNDYLNMSTGESLLGGWMALIGLLVLVFACFVLRVRPWRSTGTWSSSPLSGG